MITYFSLVYVFERISNYTFVCIPFLRGGESYILGIFISGSCTHVISSFNNGCTLPCHVEVFIEGVCT